MSTKKPRCQICDDYAVVAGLCRACYSSLYYWSHKTPGQMVSRMKDLDKYRKRMEYMTGGKVQTTSRRRKAS